MMSGAVVRRTQEALGKVIKKPPLTEKLLSKPPFRYLHDIVTEVIKMTGFMKGLYTDSEMKSDNVKDKDTKIIFLQKAIDVVVMVTGEPLSVKPARIIAGHEPERTNELLQAIAKCCLSKLSSDDAVKRVLAGEKADMKGKPPNTSKSQDKENRESKEEELKSSKDKEARRNSEIKDRSTSRDRKPRQESKEEESKPREKERETSKDNARERYKDHEWEKLKEGEKDRSKNRIPKQEKETEKSRDKERGKKEDKEQEKDSEHGKEKEKKSDGGRERDRLKEKDKGKEREKDKRKERLKDGEHSKEKEKNKDQDKAEKKSTGSEETPSTKVSAGPVKEAKPHPDKEAETSTKTSRSVVTKVSRRRSKALGEGTLLQQTKTPPAVRRKDSRNNATSISPEKKPSVSSHGKVIKEGAEKQLVSDTVMSGLQKEPGQEATAQELGRKEANNDTSKVSGETLANVLHENTELELAAKLKGDSISDGEGDVGTVVQENPAATENSEIPIELPANSAERRIPRPGSARPAPPRIKRQESTELLVPERSGSGKIVSNLIIDRQTSEDDEDSQFVVEAAPQIPEMPEMEMAPEVELGDEKHGGLVKKILETKKDYEKLQQSPKSTDKEKPLVSEAARRKEKDIVSKEIEKLRTSIQTLCRSALPLGKIMDYIQEDVDAMQNELQLWHCENKQHAEALKKEQSITDSAVEPLKAELVELEQLIKDQQDKICAVKASILKNEEKIQKMVYSINLSSRR
ncbi:TRAF3-interacting protein 1 isoform X2 [Tachyglossus aculeatus]|uniref:TRAF3-interacting protein 1 isoform X2 n=1 Tax=Tachyglossus aculeatus TaxID=9261 RepID=UPI0018F77BEC|nr:TRAF3-interacting protein 1 isoform X2 [Tachyglossus aculeatus]